MTHILAVDPGKRTGIALMHFEDDEAVEVVATWDVSGSVEGFINWLDDHTNTLYDSGVMDCDGLFVVYENFIPREGKHGVEDDASRVLGALAYWAHDNGLPAVPQPPAGRLKAVPNEVLDKFYVFSGNKDRNVKEAARHAVWYLKNAMHMPTIQKGWGDG